VNTRVTLGGDGVLRLRLPRARSYVPQASVDRALPIASVRGVETRVEAFRSAGNTVTQQAYALVLSNGERILLGADRRMLEPFFGRAAKAIAQAAGQQMRDLGTVDGDPGFILVTGQSVPDWSAPGLAPAVAQKRVRDEQAAWRIAMIVASIAIGIGVIARFFD